MLCLCLEESTDHSRLAQEPSRIVLVNAGTFSEAIGCNQVIEKLGDAISEVIAAEG